MSAEFSVLMSVYKNDNCIFLNEALYSIWDSQTLKPTEIVLVKDGPLTEDLEKVIDVYKKRAPIIIVALKENQGLGMALNEGLKFCNYELVARMDADDISFSNRFEKQILFLNKNPDIHVLGSWTDEFQVNVYNVISRRKVPKEHIEITAFLKRRNPMNHPTIIFRKKSVIEVGGYKHFYLNEDYYLWARMINKNFVFYNLQESLLYFRTGIEVYKRRGGIKYAFQDYKLQREFKKMNIVNNCEFICNSLSRCSTRLLPSVVRGFLYKTLLRK